MHGSFLEANTSFCHALGYSQAEMRVKTIYELTLPEDLAELMKVLCSLLTAAAGTSVQKHGIRLMHRNGQYNVFNLDLSAHQVFVRFST